MLRKSLAERDFRLRQSKSELMGELLHTLYVHWACGTTYVRDDCQVSASTIQACSTSDQPH